MNLEFFFLLLPWLGIFIESAEATIYKAIYIQNQSSPLTLTETPINLDAIYSHRKELATRTKTTWQICRPEWDTDDRLTCRRSDYHGLFGYRRVEEGWSVYCPPSPEWKSPATEDGGCYVTPRDSTCARIGYQYVGHICDLPRHPRPQEDALSNQTSEPDINRNALKYLAIAIFMGAFFFPCVLGICCFYWGEDAECHEEENDNLENGEPHMTRTISIIGRNTSSVDGQSHSADTELPSYEACNDGIVVEDEKL